MVVDGDRIGEAHARVDLEVDGGDGALLPGLINAHDHLHRNHYPRLGAPPYEDVYAWGKDIHARYGSEIARARTLPPADALLFGAFKNLVGGATTVVHHDAWHDLFLRDFPVRVPRLRHIHTLRTEPDRALEAGRGGDGTELPDRADGGPLLLHLAEGTGPAAAEEVHEAQRLGLLGPDLVAVHCVGVDAEGAAALARAGAAVTWCPTSNRFLYGRGPSRALLRSGVDVLLGTDALVSGEGTLLDELRAAAADGHLDGPSLRDAVGARAARRLSLPAPLLEPGAPADVVALRRPLLEARAVDVALVVSAGLPRLVDERFLPLMRLMRVEAAPLSVGGERRWVEARVAAAVERALNLLPGAARFLD